MDVHCDKCQTEYELDEARLKPGGVTVKCTTCGHLFRVRKRATTAVGMGLSGSPSGVHRPSAPVPQARGAKPGTMPGPIQRAEAALAGGVPKPIDGPGTQSKPNKERNWLIRLPTGKVETCRELATLQQWIISGRVSRNSGISRSGSTWKKLGDIGHLASFFEIADQARSARHELAVPMPATSTGAAQTPKRPVIAPTGSRSAEVSASAPAASIGDSPSSAFAASPRTPTPSPQPVSEVQFPSSPQSSTATDSNAEDVTQPAGKGPEKRAKRATDQRSKRESAEWIREGKDPENAGPTGGLTRGIPTADVAFGKSQIRPLDDSESSGFGAHTLDDADQAFDDELDEFAPSRGGVGRWIVAISLFVMAGAGIAIYFLVLRTPDAQKSASGDGIAATDIAGSATNPITPPNPGNNPTATTNTDPITPNVSVSRDEILAMADKDVLAFDKAALETSRDRLAKLEQTDEDVVVLVARARVHTALAQHSMDEARLAKSKRAAKKLQKMAAENVLQAWKWTKKTLEKDRKAPAANALMADIVRLQGKRSKQVDRYLKVVRKKQRNSREAALIQALTYIRDRRERKGRLKLGKLTSGDGAIDKSGDLRSTYRLAFLDYRAENHEEARKRIQSILTLQPEHASARALLAHITDATAVDTTDPLPPEDGKPDSSDNGTGDRTNDGSGGSDSYASLLSRADRKAEYGDCKGALQLYEKAVELNPIGVDALTGMGYCFIDQKKFSSAHAKFKTALVAAHNFQDAMWGIAEAYQQQGNKSKAVDAFKRFLEVHGNSRRGEMAKRQIERLGGTVDDPGASTNTKPDDTKPDDTKPDDTKPDDTKPDDAKPDDAKPDDAKPDDAKPDDAKPDDAKPDDTKPDDTKPGDTKPNDAKTPTPAAPTKPAAPKPAEASADGATAPSGR